MVEVKVVTVNAKGKIELYPEELEKMLNEYYDKGYSDGRQGSWITATPSITSPTITPYYSGVPDHTITTTYLTNSESKS